MAALLGAEPGLRYLHTYTRAKTALFCFGKKAIWAVSVDFLSEPEASRNKSNLPKSLVFPGCLLLGEVARASLLSVYLEKYNGISAQLSTIRKKSTKQMNREGERKTDTGNKDFVLQIYLECGYASSDTNSLEPPQVLVPQNLLEVPGISIWRTDFNEMLLLMKLRNHARACRTIHAKKCDQMRLVNYSKSFAYLHL